MVQRQGEKGRGWVQFPGKQETGLLSKLQLRGLSYQKSSEAAGSQTRCRNNLPWTANSFLFQEKPNGSGDGFHLEPIYLGGSQGRHRPWDLGTAPSSLKAPGSLPTPSLRSAPPRFLLFWPLSSTLPFLNPNSSFRHLSLPGNSCWDFSLPEAQKDGAGSPLSAGLLRKCPWQELRAPCTGSLAAIWDFNRHQNRKTFPVMQSEP